MILKYFTATHEDVLKHRVPHIVNQFALRHLQVLIGPHMFSSGATSQTWCIMPQKFIPVKEKQTKSWGAPIN